MSDKSTQAAARQRLSSPERRAAIVDAALHLFAEKGFRGTTTRELAARVGVSEPVLYEHFKTKSDLYSAIIEAKSQQASTQQASQLLEEHARNGDQRAFFALLGNLVVEWYENDPAFVRLLLFSGLEGHELKDLFYQRQSVHLFRLIADFIQSRIAAGTMRPMNPEVAARAFFGMVGHYCLSKTIFSCATLEAPKETVVTTMVDIFLNGVTTCGEGDARK